MTVFIAIPRACRRLVLVIGIVHASLASAAALELRPGAAVVELFTSQGCSSCPPADLLLSELAQRGDVVTLAYHVDYWDYVGWVDTFALPAHGELQKAYAQSWNKSRIYTPQMVINGVSGVVGSQADAVHGALSSLELVLPVHLEAEGEDSVTLTVGPQAGLGEAVVWLVTFRARAEVDIARGENTGRHLVYTHIVTGRQPVGMWDPARGAEIRIPLNEALGAGSDGLALLIQEKRGDLPGRILGAASVLR